MEPVSEEFVEQYFDFFYQLNDEQLKERKEEFKKKQLDLYLRNVRMESTFQSKASIDLFWKATLLITYCFESYGIKIPVVTDKIVEKTNKKTHKLIDELKKTNEENSIVEILLEEINQPDFFEFIESKLNYFEEEKNLITGKENTLIYNHMAILSQLYLFSMGKLN
jgi:hypothetical protein